MSIRNNRILIIRMSALGDVAMTIPVIYSLAKSYPSLSIDVLTQEAFVDLFINAPTNIRVLTYNLKNIGCVDFFRQLNVLSSYGYCYVADLHNVLRSWLIDLYLVLKGAKLRMVNKKRMGRLVLLMFHKKQTNFMERYVDVFCKLGFEVNLDFCSVYPAALPFSLELKAHKGKNIGIAPFARYDNKIYSLDKMRMVVGILVKKGFKVYLFGGGVKEVAILDKWQQEINGCVSVAGKYSIQEELSVINEMALMITMDSANQHLAALVNTTVLSIWGGTTPACGFLGLRQHAENVICLNLRCQPCSIAGSRHCSHNLKCLNLISPEMVVEKVLWLI